MSKNTQKSKRRLVKTIQGGATETIPGKKKTLYEELQVIFNYLVEKFQSFIKKNANAYSISDFIELSPTKQSLVDGKLVTSNLTPLKKQSFTYMILYIVMLFVFSVIPAIILGMSLYYFVSLMNISKWFRKKMFYGDDVSYQDIDRVQFVFRMFYLNDFTLYIIIICLIYVLALLYMSFSSYVKKSNESFRKYHYSVYALLILCVFIIAIHLAIYYKFLQETGRVRDKINNTVYNHINFDYVDYLINLDSINDKCKEECEMKLPTGDTIKLCSCEQSIIEINSIDHLQTYIAGLLTELEADVAPADITNVSAETFKKYKNKKTDKFYFDLIVDAIMTFSLLLNFANTKYDINITKSFLENRTPIIATINDATNILYDFSQVKCTDGVSNTSCLNRDMDGKQNKSLFMISACDEVQNLIQDVRTNIGRIKNKMGTLTVSIQFFSVFLTLIACIIYYTSFT